MGTDPGHFSSHRKEETSRVFRHKDPRVYKVFRHLLNRARFAAGIVNDNRLDAGEVLTSYQGIADACYPGDRAAIRKDFRISRHVVMRIIRYLKTPYGEMNPETGEEEVKKPEIKVRQARSGGGLIITLTGWKRYNRWRDFKGQWHEPTRVNLLDVSDVAAAGLAEEPPAKKKTRRRPATDGLFGGGNGKAKKGRSGGGDKPPDMKVWKTLKDVRLAEPTEPYAVISLFRFCMEKYYHTKKKKTEYTCPVAFDGKNLKQAKGLLKIEGMTPGQIARAIYYYPFVVEADDWLRNNGGFTWRQFHARFEDFSARAEELRDKSELETGITKEGAKETIEFVEGLVAKLSTGMSFGGRK